VAKKNKGGVKKAIREAGPIISKKEMNQIVKAAGGDVQKAVNRIASVQQNAPVAPSVASGAANMLIKQATPGTNFGTSRLGQTLQGMMGTPGSPGQRNPQSGAPYGGSAVAATPAQLMMGGTMIRPGGRIAVAPQQTGFGVPTEGPVPGKPPAAPAETTTTTPTTPEVSNPYQAVIDALLGELSGVGTQVAAQNANFQDMLNQQQLTAQQQMADMSALFNQQIASTQDMYNMQIQQANAQALADQEANRAFMINQGRAMSPANLQIGSLYSTPTLPGTQSFKQPERVTQPEVPTAFVTPTLDSDRATRQRPTIINI
jgi:hypothetical protein